VCTTVVIGETLEKAWKAPVSGRIDGVTAFGFDLYQAGSSPRGEFR
jgi:hypothetical protein